MEKDVLVFFMFIFCFLFCLHSLLRDAAGGCAGRGAGREGRCSRSDGRGLPEWVGMKLAMLSSTTMSILNCQSISFGPVSTLDFTK